LSYYNSFICAHTRACKTFTAMAGARTSETPFVFKAGYIIALWQVLQVLLGGLLLWLGIFKHTPYIKTFDAHLRSTTDIPIKMPVFVVFAATLASSFTNLALFGGPKVPQPGETIKDMKVRIGHVRWSKHALVVVLAVSTTISAVQDFLTVRRVVFAMPNTKSRVLGVFFMFAISSNTKTACSLMGIRWVFAQAAARQVEGNVSIAAHMKNVFWPRTECLSLIQAVQGSCWLHWSNVLVGCYGSLFLLQVAVALPALAVGCFFIPLLLLSMMLLVSWKSIFFVLAFFVPAPWYARWELQHKKQHLSIMMVAIMVFAFLKLGFFAFLPLCVCATITSAIFALFVTLRRVVSAMKQAPTEINTMSDLEVPLAAAEDNDWDQFLVEHQQALPGKMMLIGSLLCVLDGFAAMTLSLRAQRFMHWTVKARAQLVLLLFASVVVGYVFAWPFWCLKFTWICLWLSISSLLGVLPGLCLFPIMGIIGYIWDVRRFSLACRELFWGEVPNDYGRWRDQFTAILICDLRGVDGCASQTLIRESVTCWSKYDATWFEATGGSIHDWTAYFGFSFWGGAVIPILCTMAFRLYVGDGVWGSVFETWKDRNLARYLHALDAKIHKEGLVAAKMLLHTHWTVFHRIAICSETFNLLS